MMNFCLRILLVVVLGLACLTSYGQAIDELYTKLGDESYGFGDKKDARDQYLLAIENNPRNAKAQYMAGKCYLETVQKELSVDFFLKAYEIDPNIAPDILFKIANAYQLGAKFQDAIKYYKMHQSSLTDDKAKKLGTTLSAESLKCDRKVYECMNGDTYYSNSMHYKIENIKNIVNSEYPDYAPVITADQTLMIFTSRREGGIGGLKDVDNEFFEDVWYTEKVNGEWTKPKNMGPTINGPNHDGSIGLSALGDELFIYKPTNGGDIYVSKRKEDGTWSNIKNMGRHVNSRYNEPSVSISKDEKTLYFSSDRPGGKGGFDIYKAELDKNGDWGEAVNLGDKINTPFDEDSPFIDIDGKTLYFSSRGHKGIGGYDIYKTIYDDTAKTWSDPQNMGYPINSPDDDIYFVIAGDGKTGYYSSAKGDGYGDKDIYKIYLANDKVEKTDSVKKVIEEPIIQPKKDTVQKDTSAVTTQIEKKLHKEKEETENEIENDKVAQKNKKEKPVTERNKVIAHEKPKPVKKTSQLFPTILQGKITDHNTDEPLLAHIVISDLKGNTISEIDTDNNGKYSIEISQQKAGKISITISKEEYIYANVNIIISADAKVQKKIVRDIGLKKISKGEIFILRNIYFEFDAADIKHESFQYLDKLVTWLKVHPSVKIEIGGHTDNMGMEHYNKILSQKRVNSVLLYFKAKGISSDRMTAVGYGEEKPIATNDDEQEGREINRRTEFKITSK
jgi:outer membrane protein OmpA-like peptidoglycan-associated protein